MSTTGILHLKYNNVYIFNGIICKIKLWQKCNYEMLEDMINVK